MTPCIVSGPSATQPSPTGRSRSLWNVMVGKRSTSKKSLVRRWRSRFGQPVSRLFVSNTAVIDEFAGAIES